MTQPVVTDGALPEPVVDDGRGLRDWWLRTLLVLTHPRAVFVAVRDESDASHADRSEPILLVVWLAGIAYALAASGHIESFQGVRPDHGQFVPFYDLDGVDVALWGFLGGGVIGVFAYFILGAILHWAVRSLGSLGTYRRTRHVLAFASMPLVLSLVIWPFKLGVYGEDVFRDGGRDHGAGAWLFTGLELGFLVWGIALLVLGIRSVHGWTWGRALGAVAIAAAAPTALGFALTHLGG